MSKDRALETEPGIPSSVSSHLHDPAQSERLRQLIETCRDAVIFINREGQILLVNQATVEIFGFAREELLGADVRLLMAEPYASHHRQYVARYERTGEKRAIGLVRRVSAKRKSGEEFPIELSVTEIGHGVDDVAYAAFIRDVTDKVRLQADLIDRERLATVGTTASMLVHEVGNPLNNLGLQLQALRRRLSKIDEDGQLVKKIDSCSAEIARLSRLTQEFRALSGRRRLSRRRTRITEIIESVLTNYLLRQESILLRREFEDTELEALVDPDKILQVVLNLCQNAVEAMPEGGELTLRTRQEGTTCTIEIADTGHGISEGLDVFEPFATTKTQGTGLGLAICSEIIRDHGGTLDYESVPNQGTTFRFQLPLWGDRREEMPREREE